MGKLKVISCLGYHSAPEHIKKSSAFWKKYFFVGQCYRYFFLFEKNQFFFCKKFENFSRKFFLRNCFWVLPTYMLDFNDRGLKWKDRMPSIYFSKKNKKVFKQLQRWWKKKIKAPGGGTHAQIFIKLNT